MRNKSTIALFFIFPLFLSVGLSHDAQAVECNAPAPDVETQVSLRGHPFAAVPSADGCTIFVSITGQAGRSYVAVLARADGHVSVERYVDAEGNLTGMALSPDGRYLAVTNGIGVTLFDAERLRTGVNNAMLGYLNDGEDAGSVYLSFSPDQHLLFVSDEHSHSLSVYDFVAILSGKTAKMIGQIQAGGGPVGLAFSPDGKLLYSTSEVVRPGSDCSAENGSGHHGLGGILVVDVDKAATDPEHSALAHVLAGCNPVRIAISPDGKFAYVSARGEDAVLVFDTSKLISDRDQAMVAKVKVGTSPVGVAATKNFIFVTNSDRFGDSRNQAISVLDANNLTAKQRSIPAGGFPRELKLTTDGNTLLVTNFVTNTLELVDLARLGQSK